MEINKFKLRLSNLGNIQKIIAKNSKHYKGFGELYISEIKPLKTKGWNLHKKMTLNIFVIKGRVQITEIYKNKIIKKIFSENSNKIITIKPMRWIRLKNLLKSKSKIINFANYLHDKKEIIKK